MYNQEAINSHRGPGRSTDSRMAKRRIRLSVLTRSGRSDRPKSSTTADLAPAPSVEELWTRPKPSDEVRTSTRPVEAAETRGSTRV